MHVVKSHGRMELHTFLKLAVNGAECCRHAAATLSVRKEYPLHFELEVELPSIETC